MRFLGMENKPRLFPYLLAVGIPHQLQAANLPCLAASLCLIPSFCLSQRWNVNHAPTLGLCPKGKIQLDCPGSTLSMCFLFIIRIDVNCYLLASRFCPLRPSNFFATQSTYVSPAAYAAFIDSFISWVIFFPSYAQPLVKIA